MTAAQAARSTGPSVSVVVPAFREAENLPVLVARLDRVRRAHDLALELIVVDDDSRDGTEGVIASLRMSWVRLIVRTGVRGLSSAVLDGLAASKHDVLVVMDADLSHAPEEIPNLIAALAHDADFVVGSRYVRGGGTDDDWGISRQLNSRLATWLARPFTRIRDPMSGFFALRAETFKRGRDWDPIGYKIGLELIVKCQCRRVREVPIFFVERARGESKLTFAERLRYLEHVRRLLAYRYPRCTFLVQVGIVGAAGAALAAFSRRLPHKPWR